MNIKQALKIGVVATVAASTLGLAQLGRTQTNGEMPWRIYGPGSSTAGSTITASVELDGVVSSDTTVYLSGSNYSYMPSYVTVHAGNSVSDDFYPTIATGATGYAGITASCNGGYASYNVRISQSSPPPIPPAR